MDYEDKESLDQLENIQGEFPPEVWLLLGAGFEMLPRELINLIGDNAAVIESTVNTVPMSAHGAHCTSVYTYNIDFIKSAVLNQYGLSMPSEAKAYFYPRNVGRYASHVSNDTRWLMFTIKRGSHTKNMQKINALVANYVERARIEAIHG